MKKLIMIVYILLICYIEFCCVILSLSLLVYYTKRSVYILKNKLSFLVGTWCLLAALLIGFGPFTLFPVCNSTGKIMKCLWSAKAEIAIAIILGSVGTSFFCFYSNETHKAISLIAIVTSIASILIPSCLIGYCVKPDMSCRSITFPIIYAIATTTIIVNVIYFIYLIKKESGNDKKFK